MHPKDAEGIANSVDPAQTAVWSGFCTVCPDLSARKLKNITVMHISEKEQMPWDFAET